MDLRLGRFLLVFVVTLATMALLKQAELRYDLGSKLPQLFWIGVFIIIWAQSYLVRKWCLKRD